MRIIMIENQRRGCQQADGFVRRLMIMVKLNNDDVNWWSR